MMKNWVPGKKGNVLHEEILRELEEFGPCHMSQLIGTCRRFANSPTAIENHVHELLSYEMIQYREGMFWPMSVTEALQSSELSE